MAKRTDKNRPSHAARPSGAAHAQVNAASTGEIQEERTSTTGPSFRFKSADGTKLEFNAGGEANFVRRTRRKLTLLLVVAVPAAIVTATVASFASSDEAQSSSEPTASEPRPDVSPTVPAVQPDAPVDPVTTTSSSDISSKPPKGGSNGTSGKKAAGGLLTKTSKDPTEAWAGRNGDCEFRIAKFPGGKFAHTWRHGAQRLSDCESALRLTCHGLTKGRKYKVLTGGTLSVQTNNQAEFGSWPKWPELHLRMAGNYAEPCNGFASSYDAEHNVDHSVNICGSGVASATDLVVDLCYHRCKQGNGSSVCTFHNDFVVQVAPA